MRRGRGSPLALAPVLALLAAACASTPSPPALPSASADGAAPGLDGGSQLMVTLFPGPPQSWQRALADLQANYDVRPLALWPIESLDGVPCALLEVPPGRDPAELAGRLAGDPRVESAQPVYRFELLAGQGDPYAQLQHAARDLRLAAAHRRSTGKGVRVAVVDTGVDFSHPDLVARVVGARDFVSREDRPAGAFTADVHGTGVAGVIAATADNGVGIVGVAPEAEILAVKSCWTTDRDRNLASCDSYTLAQGLDFAIEQGARVINLSLTGPRDPLLARLVAAALGRGI
ncbi:MAG TPA: S8 family serine peptidase, partial [Thermoanaerobaculia bacterium]|nr:S8 family serine peptidase [Thermoanaerobaculia bacterium]